MFSLASVDIRLYLRSIKKYFTVFLIWQKQPLSDINRGTLLEQHKTSHIIMVHKFLIAFKKYIFLRLNKEQLIQCRINGRFSISFYNIENGKEIWHL
jgi:hypothetical protein